MSQVTVKLVPVVSNNTSTVEVNIIDSGYQNVDFRLYPSGVRTKTTNSDGSVTYNSPIATMLNTSSTQTPRLGGGSNYNYVNKIFKNTSISNNLLTTSNFTTITNNQTTPSTENSFVEFIPLDINGNVNTNIVQIRGSYFNSQTGYGSPFAANYLVIEQPTLDNPLNLTYFKFQQVYTNNNNIITNEIGKITYDPTQNTYTAFSSNPLYNYQNLLILANKSIVHFTNYPGSSQVTPAILDAMYDLNSYVFNRLLDFI